MDVYFCALNINHLICSKLKFEKQYHTNTHTHTHVNIQQKQWFYVWKLNSLYPIFQFS